MNGLQFAIGDLVGIKVNGKQSQTKVIGFELWHGKSLDWRYTLEIKEYPFAFTVLQNELINGINIETNGNSLKVLPTHEKTK